MLIFDAMTETKKLRDWQKCCELTLYLLAKTMTAISDIIPIILLIDPTNNRFPISNDIDQIGDIPTTTIGATYPDTPTTISATYPPISTSSVSAGISIYIRKSRAYDGLISFSRVTHNMENTVLSI